MQLTMRFSLRTLFLLPLFFGVTISGIWWWPKSQPLSINTSVYVGYYRGLGLTTDSSFFGKQFFRLRVDDGQFGYWEVDYDKPGYNRYRGFYVSGVLREVGECFVEINGGTEDPAPDNHNLRWGKYYKPDGTLGSEVVNGSGIQTYWYLDGTKRWELELNNFTRVRILGWHPNGQRSRTEYYKNGKLHGEFRLFDSSGTLRLKGEYDKGYRVGKWICYNDKGNVESLEDFSSTSPP